MMRLPFKTYPDSLRRVELPKPDKDKGPGLWETIRARRSVREYAGSGLPLASLSRMLWAAQGVTAETHGYSFRAAPSAGGLYPVETYVVANNVDGLDRGVYHYDVQPHALTCVKEGDFRGAAASAALDQAMARRAAVTFIWTAVVGRCGWKYGQRAYRYIYLDAGHVAQNVALAAVALGCGSCQIGALYDQEVADLVGADGAEEVALYMTSVGPIG